MAERGEDYSSDNESDVAFSLGSDIGEDSSDDTSEFENDYEHDEAESDDENDLFEESEPELLEESEDSEESEGTGNKPDVDRPRRAPFNISKFVYSINERFYGHRVAPLRVNIMTDFVDAEIFLIDGDSLLLDLFGERRLDWSNGGQFLHLTYLVERFLQYFTDKGGVFHIVFFKDMEIIWRGQPSMLLARQALILHLKYNTAFTVVTSIDHFLGKQWRDYVDDKLPAFLLLTDAEKIPCETTGEKMRNRLQFLFRSLLFYSLGQGLNCVFISGIEMTATKVMGYYMESLPEHRSQFKKLSEPSWKAWLGLMEYFRKEGSSDDHMAPGTSLLTQFDPREKVKCALQSPHQRGCRELATLLGCEMLLNKIFSDPNVSKEAAKTAEDRVKLFLLHSILLKKLPLKYRAHTLIEGCLLTTFCETQDGQFYNFDEIHKCLWEILKVIQDEYPSMTAASHSLDMTSVADLMDGRLVHTLFSLALGLEGIKADSLHKDVTEEAETAWGIVITAVKTTCTQHSDVLSNQFLPFLADIAEERLATRDEYAESEPSVKLTRLLEVKNALVSEYAGNMRSKINDIAGDDVDDTVFYEGRAFDELYHWHSLRPLSDDYDRTKSDIKEKPPDDPKKRFWYFKRKQEFARFHRLYGDSLSDGVDRAKTITVTETETKKKKGKDKTAKMSSKAAKIIEDNKRKRKEQQQEKVKEKWTHVMVEIDKNLKRDNYSTALQVLDKFLTDCESREFSLQALMKKAQSCLDAWQDTRSRDAISNDMKYPVLLMESVRKITEEFEVFLTDKDKKKMAGYMQKLGFEDIAAMFYKLNPETDRKAGKLSLNTTSARFQLEHMGHLLKREERTDPDRRVDHFIPDTWQRELLDAVDNNESAVIIAPTSSGKTYASYYCMEKVLRESNSGVVVYVSPTKALVNQVAATIYARFHRKKLPAGKAVYGVFTRDYQYNTLNSQILVTVPQCLEILFLSPRRQDWTKNIKYVIFDEVHCLGQEIGAEVWEHLLLLIRCPFLALSATIGNPHDLLNWLQAAQDFRERQDKQDGGKLRKSYRIRLVTCKERYSDLEKSIYLPSPKNGGFSELTRTYEDGFDVTKTDEFVSLHPCAQLGAKQLKENGFPSDFSLSPKETLQLYDVMLSHWPDRESLKRLAPEQYFKEKRFIHKKHVREYEEELKKEFKSWTDHQEQFKKAKSVIKSLNSVCEKKLTSIEGEWSELGIGSTGKRVILHNYAKLVEQLKAQDKLPALVFSFDRRLCELLAFILTEQFEDREDAIRERTRKSDEKKRSQAEKKAKRTRDATEKEKEKRSSSKRDKLEEEQDDKNLPDLDEPLPQCTLSVTHGIGKQRVMKIMHRIREIHSRGPFKRALRRGISFHHAGMKNKIRTVVEMLFREKCLQVVSATGTLALGIHMPCKTVVFAGDSPFLNSLMYRQMSGRAGRRGFDPVGNVIFFGIPYQKVQRLMTANIPKLVGNFPINVSLVLRLLLMTSTGDDKQDAFTKALALLSHPFICKKHPEMESQIKKHFLFSVELLARLGLINKDTGAPQEMAGLVTHLHYHEPSNFVLVSFLQKGLFHELCEPGENGRFSEDVMRSMVLILNHLFGRTFLHSSYKRWVPSCPTSKVVLEDLPEEFSDALQGYNAEVTKVFSQYLITVATEHERQRGEENKLPLSGIVFPDQGSINLIDEYGIIKSLGRSSIMYTACSSFAALSGNSDLKLHSENQEDDEIGEDTEDEDWDRDTTDEERDDEFDSEDEGDDVEPIDHLLKIVRQDVYTDMNVVPVLPLKKRDLLGRVQRLNSYALDFFKHGSAKCIEKENRIRPGEVFNALKDFYLVIRSVSCSLEELGPETDNVVLAFKQLAEEFGAKFRKQYDVDI
ncbi:putative ATP-dependent RNA helicase ddx60 [Porites harrisoni]